ncbi:MAG TPA: restriction endonuclease [Burkholderiales bacterium]
MRHNQVAHRAPESARISPIRQNPAMGRRKRNGGDTAKASIATVPWWGWLLLGGVAWLLARGLVAAEMPTKGQPAQIIATSLLRVLGMLLSVLGPIIFVMLAVISARARRRTALAPASIKPIPGTSPGSSAQRDDDIDLYAEWKSAGQADTPASIETKSWNLGLIRALEWKRLEQLGALYFRALGFKVEEADHGPDGGVDLRLFVGASPTPGILVQCKAWNSWKVGVKEVRALFGVMAKEGVNEGILLTTSTFTDEAVVFARGTNIALIEGTDLLRKLRDLPAQDQSRILKTITSGDFTTPTCPSCGIKMVKRVAKESGDAFWGCARYPACRRTFQFMVR